MRHFQFCVHCTAKYEGPLYTEFNRRSLMHKGDFAHLESGAVWWTRQGKEEAPVTFTVELEQETDGRWIGEVPELQVPWSTEPPPKKQQLERKLSPPGSLPISWSTARPTSL